MKRFHLTLLTATLLVSCNEDSRVADLGERLRLAEEEIKSLHSDMIALKIDREFEEYTFLRPSEPDFSAMNLSVGRITVAVKNVEAYADGCKVTLQFGNPLFSKINGVNFDVEYGSLNDAGVFDSASKKTKKITLSEPLQSGAWTDSVIILDGIRPDKLGQLKIYNPSIVGLGLIRANGTKD